MFSRPVFAGNLCLFAVLALSAAVFSAGCEMNVSESPVLDEIEAAYRGLQGGGVILPGTSGSAPDGAPGGNAGNGGQTGGYPQHKPGPSFPYDGITYHVTEDGTGLEVSGGLPDADGLLRILPEVYGLPVTGIRTQAFQHSEYSEDIRFVDLSGCGNLQEIRVNAFHACGSLEAVDLSGCPDLKEIADFAFDSCTSLERLYLCGSAGSLISVSSTAFSQDVIIYVEDEAEKNCLLGVLYVPGIVEICPEKHPHSSFPSP